MIANDNGPLSKPKTRSDLNFEEIFADLRTRSPYGAAKKKNFKPFMPGEEHALTSSFDNMEILHAFMKDESDKANEIRNMLCEIKQIALLLERCKDRPLGIVELFDLKVFLLLSSDIRQILSDSIKNLPEVYTLEDTEELLSALDPSGERLETFYIYDSFSPALAEIRTNKRELEKEYRKEQKKVRAELESSCDIRLNPKFEVIVSRLDKEELAVAETHKLLRKQDEDYGTITFTIAPSDRMLAITEEEQRLEALAEEAELAVCAKLTEKVAEFSERLSTNCEKIGNLDFDVGRLEHRIRHECVRPEIVEDYILSIEGGRNLVVESVLRSKGKKYCKVGVDLKEGVFAITGANMGGKTVSLKMIGQVALMTQYGMYVPCDKAKVGLSSYIVALAGDTQSITRGLSSFGGEMEELREILDRVKPRSLILIDEIASGTNPKEGLALTASFMEYFSKKPYITVITTHFDYARMGQGVVSLQVAGLAGADFKRLSSEILSADRKQRIEIIGKYMDYRLIKIEEPGEIPKDALKIARMLGVYEEIIDKAKEFISKQDK